MVGRKVGMTRYFTEDGKNIPVTVIEAGPCVVTQVKTVETDGYSAVQLGFEDVKPRRSTRAQIAQAATAHGGAMLSEVEDIKTIEKIQVRHLP